MIELSVPANAAKGSSFDGSFRISGDDAQALQKARGVEISFSCLIVDSGKSGKFGSIASAIKEKQELQGKDSEVRNFSSYFPMKTVWHEKKQLAKAASGAFSFQIPHEHPETYKGKLFNVTWVVQLKIDLPLKFDKNECREVLVR